MRNLQSVGQLLLQCVVCFSTMGVGISQASNAVEKELSVPPMDFHEYPQGRPNWINVSDLEGREVAVTSARETQEEATREIIDLKRQSALHLLQKTFLDEADRELITVLFSDAEIEKLLVTKNYSGKVKVGGNTRYECAAELMMSEEAEVFFKLNLLNQQIRRRIKTISISMLILSCSFFVIGWLVKIKLVERASQGNKASA